MKKLFFLLSIFIASHAFAQQKPLKYGWRFAGNASTMAGIVEPVNSDTKIGYSVGFMFTQEWGKRSAFDAEAHYMRANTAISSHDMDFRMNYLGIEFKYRFYALKKLSLQAGYQFNFDLNADNTETLQRYVHGFVFGLGYEINDHFGIDANLFTTSEPITRIEWREEYKNDQGETQFRNKIDNFNLNVLSINFRWYLGVDISDDDDLEE